MGDDVDKARRFYGKRLSVTPHLCFERGLMLALNSPYGKYVLVMEGNDKGRLITLRGGLVLAASYLEGCRS